MKIATYKIDLFTGMVYADYLDDIHKPTIYCAGCKEYVEHDQYWYEGNMCLECQSLVQVANDEYPEPCDSCAWRDDCYYANEDPNPDECGSFEEEQL